MNKRNLQGLCLEDLGISFLDLTRDVRKLQSDFAVLKEAQAQSIQAMKLRPTMIAVKWQEIKDAISSEVLSSLFETHAPRLFYFW
jgi:hypothetical protein